MADGLAVVVSRFGQAETMQRLVAGIGARGMQVFARIDHAAAAQEVGMELEPTELVVFGDPRAGTILMQKRQSVGIDLPLKFLVTTEQDGQTRVSYNLPAWVAERHGVASEAAPLLAKMTGALAALAAEAAGAE